MRRNKKKVGIFTMDNLKKVAAVGGSIVAAAAMNIAIDSAEDTMKKGLVNLKNKKELKNKE